MKNELQLIKTLANESEIISTKDNFFLPPIKKELQDLDVTGWDHSKNQNLSVFFPSPVFRNNAALRESHNLKEMLQMKLSRSPPSIHRLQSNCNNKSKISLSRTTVYKVSNISLNGHGLSMSVDRRPKLPRINKNALMSIYLSHKRSKKRIIQKSSQLAEVNDLLILLKPELKNPVKTRVMSNLRSKINLNRTISRRMMSKSPENFAVSISQNSEYKS